MEQVAGRLEAVLVSLGVDPVAELGVQHHGQIRSQILGGPARDALDVGKLKNPPSPW